MKFATFAVTLAIASPTVVSADGAVDEIIAMEQQILAEEKALLSLQTPDVEADIAAATAELDVNATAANATAAMTMSDLVPMAGHASGGDVADSWHSAHSGNGTEPTHVTHDGSHHGGMSKEEYKEYTKAAKKSKSKSSSKLETVEVWDAHKSKGSKHGKMGKRGKTHPEGDAEIHDDGWSAGTMETAAGAVAADVELSMSMPAAMPPAEQPVEEVEEEEDPAVKPPATNSTNSTEPPAANSTRVGVDTKGISKASAITAEQEARANVHDMVSTAILTGKGPEHHGSNHQASHQAKKGGVEGAAAELEREKSTDAQAFDASGSAAERSFRLGIALCLGTFVYAAGR
mmetsp:Transcript_127/g.333  ORF Transcript_127/g.333 Transcript_127/m.333 type:complete len:346 (-) Transcript_127:201-1238(-)